MMQQRTHQRYYYLKFKDNTIFRRYVSKTQEAPPVNHQAKLIYHGSYNVLLFRPEWKEKREEILNRDKVFVICKSPENLQVHHRQYHYLIAEECFNNPREYSNSLLITLDDIVKKYWEKMLKFKELK